MIAKVYKNILFASLWKYASKLIEINFIMQQDNDPKHTATSTKNFIRGDIWKFLD